MYSYQCSGPEILPFAALQIRIAINVLQVKFKLIDLATNHRARQLQQFDPTVNGLFCVQNSAGKDIF